MSLHISLQLAYRGHDLLFELFAIEFDHTEVILVLYLILCLPVLCIELFVLLPKLLVIDVLLHNFLAQTRMPRT